MAASIEWMLSIVRSAVWAIRWMPRCAICAGVGVGVGVGVGSVWAMAVGAMNVAKRTVVVAMVLMMFIGNSCVMPPDRSERRDQGGAGEQIGLGSTSGGLGPTLDERGRLVGIALLCDFFMNGEVVRLLSGMENWFAWTIAGLVLAVGAGGFSVVWWKFADRWAEDEKKRFAGKGTQEGQGRKKANVNERVNEGAQVIKNFYDQGGGQDRDGEER